ncbi:MAG: pentapeptide repeat-containing protein [Pseudomonadota bacterium]
MNQEESIALYKKGIDAWNKWANEMLAQKKALEDDKQWQIDVFGEGGNDSTKNWIQKASVDFSGYVFEQNTSFASHTFPYATNFSKSKFEGGITSFQHSEFKGNTLFIGAEFNSNDTIFEVTKFHSNVKFYNTFFNGNVSFNFAEFRCSAGFNNAIFQGCEFYDTEFHDVATFVGSKFVERVNFHKARFHSGASFERSEFESKATFIETNFIDSSDFTGATFNNIADFYKTTFCMVVFKEAYFKKRVSFDEVIFEKESSFVAMNAQSFFSLEGTKFHFVPDFSQANFTQAPQFDATDFSHARKLEQYDKSLNLAARWRSLKRLAAQNHDREHESIFFIEEIKSKRWKQYIPIFDPMYWFEWLYGVFSDFGRSVFRPLCWLIVVTFIYFGIYIASDTESDAVIFPVCNRVEAAVYLSVRSALPFSVTHSDKLTQGYSCLYGKDIEGKAIMPNKIVFFGFSQTILSAILIFLSLLALRNHFKIS